MRIVITGSLRYVGDRVRHLVYLDACVPRDGDTLFELLGRPSAGPVRIVTRAVRRYAEGCRLRVQGPPYVAAAPCAEAAVMGPVRVEAVEVV